MPVNMSLLLESQFSPSFLLFPVSFFVLFNFHGFHKVHEYTMIFPRVKNAVSILRKTYYRQNMKHRRAETDLNLICSGATVFRMKKLHDYKRQDV